MLQRQGEHSEPCTWIPACARMTCGARMIGGYGNPPYDCVRPCGGGHAAVQSKGPAYTFPASTPKA